MNNPFEEFMEGHDEQMMEEIKSAFVIGIMRKYFPSNDPIAKFCEILIRNGCPTDVFLKSMNDWGIDGFP